MYRQTAGSKNCGSKHLEKQLLVSFRSLLSQNPIVLAW